MAQSSEICKEKILDMEKVRTVQSALPEDSEIIQVSHTFKILGDPTRLRLMLALAEQELCVCDLSAVIKLSVSAVSHQLRLLRSMKLVKFRKSGKMAFYSLDDAHIGNIIQQCQVHVRE